MNRSRVFAQRAAVRPDQALGRKHSQLLIQLGVGCGEPPEVAVIQGAHTQLRGGAHGSRGGQSGDEREVAHDAAGADAIHGVRDAVTVRHQHVRDPGFDQVEGAGPVALGNHHRAGWNRALLQALDEAGLRLFQDLAE